MSAAQASPCWTKYCFVKSPGRYSDAPLPQGIDIFFGGSPPPLALPGSLCALGLSACGFLFFILFAFPEFLIFGSQLLKIRINVFHGSCYTGMTKHYLEF